MLTRNGVKRTGSRSRPIATFCTAVAAVAALALLPAVPAAADDDVSALTTAAQEARAAADAAHAAAAQAEADSAAAATEAASLRAIADAANLSAADAAAALALDPENAVLQLAAADAQAAFAVADATAVAAEQLSADAAAAAQTALADAAALEAAAVAAEAALAAALGPPEDGALEPLLLQSSEGKSQSCNHDLQFFSQNTSNWGWCFPDPEIDIDVKNLCPTVIVVKLSNLWWWVDYTVIAGGTEVEIDVDHRGKASFTVTDFTSGKFEVKVYKGDKKLAHEREWITSDCPWIDIDVEQECTTIGGTAEVEVRVHGLQKWREYDITVTGPGGEVLTDEVSWKHYWERDLDLEPGTYTVTVTSDGGRYKPDLGPVTYEFTVAPCPGEVTITIVPKCAIADSGELGATLSGLVPGREYHVTVTGPGGIVTDVTFVADATTWPVPPPNLPAGTYTVTVVDTASDSGGTMTLLKYEEPVYDPLTWSATGTISPCPQLASTGSGPSNELLPALVLLPLGAGLLVASGLRSRRRLAEFVEGED